MTSLETGHSSPRWKNFSPSCHNSPACIVLVPDRGMHAMNDPHAAFQQHVPRLRAIAYRMLGTQADADDMLQETWLRWQRSDTSQIEEPEAWLVTTVTRLCIDRLRAVKKERETYFGPWLPEPLVGHAPPADAQAELASELSV